MIQEADTQKILESIGQADGAYSNGTQVVKTFVGEENGISLIPKGTLGVVMGSLHIYDYKSELFGDKTDSKDRIQYFIDQGVEYIYIVKFNTVPILSMVPDVKLKTLDEVENVHINVRHLFKSNAEGALKKGTIVVKCNSIDDKEDEPGREIKDGTKGVIIGSYDGEEVFGVKADIETRFGYIVRFSNTTENTFIVGNKIKKL